MPTPYTVQDMSLDEQVGQMIMVRYPDRDILREMLSNGFAGSFYFGMKGQSAQQVASALNDLQRIAKVPALVAFGSACTTCGSGLIDGSLMRVGATRDPELAYRLAWLEATEQRAYGFHIPGMPCLDVNSNPRNAIINTRAFSDDAELVCRLGLPMLRAQIDARAITCAMHFPGHGATEDDSHIRIPVDGRSEQDIWECDLLPYREAIPQGLLNGICTNHLHYPCWEPGPPAPATISHRIVTDLLRGRLGYDGLIMSDSLTMKPMKDAYGIEQAAILTVQAGHDIVLQDYQSDPRITHRALVEAVRDGRISENQVAASAARIMRYKQWMGVLEDPLVDLEQVPQRVATQEHRAFALEVARRAVTVLEDRALPLRVSAPEKLLVIANGREVAFDADMGLEHLPAFERLYRSLQRRLPGLQTCTIGEDMPPEYLDRARTMAAQAEAIVCGLFTRVLCYHEDSIGLRPELRQLLADFVSTGKPVVFCSFGNPYVLADLPKASGALCAYDEDCPESVQAAVEVLLGEQKSAGRLPVRVSERYRFGHGL